MGADSATADDVAQDAFLAGFEQIADYRGEGAFGGLDQADRRAALSAQGQARRA
jgi:DNA-directed RNA polymerase specialized sigma24 family protein